MKRRTQEEWYVLSSKYEASGLTQKEWCKANGINLHTFKDRYRKIKGSTDSAVKKMPEKSESIGAESDSKDIKWLALAPVPAKAAAQTDTTVNQSTEASLKIQVGSFTVTLSDTFNKSTFAEVCQVLISLC